MPTTISGSTGVSQIQDGVVTNADIDTVAASKLTGALPAISGASLTALNATNLGSGTVPTARLGSGSASSSVFLSGANTWIAAGESNLPAFYARLNDTEAIEIPHGGVTVISNAATGDSLTEVYDSGSAFDPATGRFTPQTAGYYVISSGCLGNPASGQNTPTRMDLRFNGSTVMRSETRVAKISGEPTDNCSVDVIQHFNGSSDYIEVGIWTYNYTNQSTALEIEWFHFSGFLLTAD